jgi:hypothetical protein
MSEMYCIIGREDSHATSILNDRGGRSSPVAERLFFLTASSFGGLQEDRTMADDPAVRPVAHETP